MTDQVEDFKLEFDDDGNVIEEIQPGEEDHVDPEIERAMAGGWRPQEEWEGDPNDWISHREFNFRGELMDRITTQGKKLGAYEDQISEMRQAVEVLTEHNRKVGEAKYNQALEDVRQGRVEALEVGDYARALELEEQENELKAKKAELDVVPEPVEETTESLEVHPTIQAWIDNPVNKWYSDNEDMADLADFIAAKEAQRGTPIEDVLKKVEARVRASFPDQFKAPPQMPSVNEPSGRKPRANSNGRKTYTARDLSPEQKDVANMLVKSGAFKNVQEYVDQLADIGEIA